METLPESETEEQEWTDVGQEDDNNRELVELEEALSNICVTSPEVPLPGWTKEVNLSHCPASYKANSPQEERLTAMADNFRRQYSHIFPERKPPLLCPRNECGVKKFVSTTLRPTLLPYSELYGWEGCAAFIAKHLTLEPLEPPIHLPRYLFSPTFVLKRQRGTCFDFSTLLCSLLLGAHYDAYCVSGYAVREMCLRDQSRQECALVANEVQDTRTEANPQVKKYVVKPPRELQSNFERRQKEKEEEEARAAQLKEQQEARRLQEESELPAPDPLLGLRVHCWVLVLSGRRDVQENFFIDPLTARSYATSHQSFLGIECLWNQHNYWVNIQDCCQGCADLLYDLGDSRMWEAFLHVPLSQGSSSSAVKNEVEGTIIEDEEEEEEPEMPRSWVSKITVSKKDIDCGWPGGVRITQYRKAKLEQFAPRVLPDGLVMRLTTYKDPECQEASIVKESFQDRRDHLEERELRIAGNITTERFRPGRSFSLQSHSYVTPTAETEREMDFYSRARADGLVRRVESCWELTETFRDRADFLCYRHVAFAQRVKAETAEAGNRSLQKVVERFHRNRSKPASDDVAERVFLLAEGRMEVTYHLEDDGIVPATRSFVKPQESADTYKSQIFTASMATGFQVTPCERPKKKLCLYEMLVALMKEEENVALSIKASEEEVRAILASREKEESSVELQVSIYDIARNKEAHCLMENMEPLAAEERWCQEKETDFLALFLAQLGNPEPLSRQAAAQLRLDCLTHFKQRMVERAKLIQAHFHKESQELQHKQQCYQQNQLTMSKEDEDKYLAYCSEAMFRIHVHNLRLSRHKETAPQKYLALEEKLRRDPRLAPHLLQ